MEKKAVAKDVTCPRYSGDQSSSRIWVSSIHRPLLFWPDCLVDIDGVSVTSKGPLLVLRVKLTLLKEMKKNCLRARNLNQDKALQPLDSSVHSEEHTCQLDTEVVLIHPGDSHRLIYLDFIHNPPSGLSGSPKGY